MEIFYIKFKRFNIYIYIYIHIFSLFIFKIFPEKFYLFPEILKNNNIILCIYIVCARNNSIVMNLVNVS